NGSIEFLTTERPDRRGISDPLQTGLGLFDPLHAVSPAPALRSVCLGTAKAGSTETAFPCSASTTDGLGPHCTPAVQRSRRATLETPNLTACHFVSAVTSKPATLRSFIHIRFLEA